MNLPILACTGVLALALLGRPAPRLAGGVEGTIATDVKLLLKGAVSQRDLVVYLEPKDGKGFDPVDAKVAVDQKKLNFEPHVLPVQKGTTVSFRNADEVKHNVFVDSPCCKLDADMNKGESKDTRFDQPGVYPIVCRLHPEMAMHVVVLDTPWFAHVEFQKVEKDGATSFRATFKLEGVPPGEYVLHTWHKKLPPLAQPVTVVEGAPGHVDLQLKKD